MCISTEMEIYDATIHPATPRPWFDTKMPSTPACTAFVASSGPTIPFRYICILVMPREALHELPGHAGAVQVVHVRYIDPAEHWFTRHFVLEPARVTRNAVAIVLAPQPEQGLGVAPALAIDGQYQRCAPAFSAFLTSAVATLKSTALGRQRDGDLGLGMERALAPWHYAGVR
jgi:hypothetical protein